MGNTYQNIDFERMLADLGAALERNKANPEPKPAPAAGIPTARFPDLPEGVPPEGAQSVPAMTISGAPPPAPMQPPSPYMPPPMANPSAGGPIAPMGNPLAQIGSTGLTPLGPPPMPPGAMAGPGMLPMPAMPPPTQYPNIDPNGDGGLAAYAALQSSPRSGY